MPKNKGLWKSVPVWEAAPEWESGKEKETMPIKFGSVLACLLAHPMGPRVLRSAAVPEFKLLALVGGGLVILATLVRWLYPEGGEAVPKSMQMRVWISPPEITEKIARRETV